MPIRVFFFDCWKARNFASITNYGIHDRTKDLFLRIAKELNIDEKYGWYKVKKEDLWKRTEVRTIVSKNYQGYLTKALQQAYPNQTFHMWRLDESVSKDYWNDKKNQRHFFDWMFQELSFSSLEDWYQVSISNLENKGSTLMLRDIVGNYYNGSLYLALQNLYPESQHVLKYWWNFVHESTRQLWKEIPYQQEFFFWIAKEFNVESQLDWFDINFSEVMKRGGGWINHFYGHGNENSFGSFIRAIQAVYPSFWYEKKHQRKFFEKIGTQLGLRKPEDWYQIQATDLADKGATMLLTNYFGGNISNALQEIFPEFNWKVWRFSFVPEEFWEHKKNHLEYLEWFSVKMDLQTFEDWYSVKRQDIIQTGGTGLLNRYNGYLSNALQHLLDPDLSWQTWKFDYVPKHFWSNPKNQRQYFDWFGITIGISKPEDGYRIMVSDIMANHGSGIMFQVFHDSVSKAMVTVYPEYNWRMWRFNQVTNSFWDSEQNVKVYLEWVAEKLNICEIEDWLTVTNEQLNGLRGAALVKKSGGIIPLLKKYFPQNSSNSQANYLFRKAQGN